MKPGVLFAACAVLAVAGAAGAPAWAQHSASGRIAAPAQAAAPATAAPAKPADDAATLALARADAALNNNGNKAKAAAAAAPAPVPASVAAPAPAAVPASAPVAATATSAPAASVTAATGGATADAANAPSPAATTTSTAAMAAAAAPAAATPALPAVNPAPAVGNSAAGSLLQTTLALAFVLALLIAAAWFLKRYGPKSMMGGTAVKLVGALNVGARERILVVEVGGQWIVVGASPGRMNALATMPRQETPPAVGPLAAQGATSANFAEWFKQTIEKRNNNGN